MVEFFLIEIVVDDNKVDVGIAGKEVIGLGIAKINKFVFGLAAFFDNLVKTIRVGFVVPGIGTGDDKREAIY